MCLMHVNHTGLYRTCAYSCNALQGVAAMSVLLHISHNGVSSGSYSAFHNWD